MEPDYEKLRISYVTSKEELSDSEQAHYEQITESRGGIRGPFGALLNCPELAGHVGSLGEHLRFNGSLAGAERELAILAVGNELDCEFIWAAHKSIALKEGISEDTIDYIIDSTSNNNISMLNKNLIEYTKYVVKEESVPDTTYDYLLEYYGDDKLVELTILIGYYGMLSYVLNTFQIYPESES